MTLAGQLTLPQSFSRAGLKHVQPKLGKLQAVARAIIERWQQPDYVQVQLSLWGCTTALPTANEVAQVAVHLALHTTPQRSASECSRSAFPPATATAA